ncbi:MAG: tetratricopeptide repeat protein, partial [Bacteroidia bacterium]|nr:tetratricopeptide repeat protein [Bacteroidia bacterium]
MTQLEAMIRTKLLAVSMVWLVSLLASGLASGLTVDLGSAQAQPPQTGTGPQAGNLQSRMQQAAGMLQRGEKEAAEAELQAILEVAPKHGPANLMLGQIRMQRGDLDAARGNFEIAVGSKVRRPYLAWHFLGRTQLELGQQEKALESFGRALEITPQFGPALLGRSKVALRLGDLEGAASDLEKARSLEGSSVEAALLLSEVLLAQGRGDEAAALLEPMAKTSGDSSESQTARMLLLSQGSDEEIRLLRRLVGENLDLASGYLALGLAELRSESLESA